MASSSLADEDFGLTTLFMEENKLSSCDICTEFTELNSINGCAHSFCIDCITKHISSKLELNVAKVLCPGLSCKTFLQTESLTPLLPKSVVDSWSDALCRDFLNDLQTLYCPFKDCSEMLLIENEGEVVRESECPSCHRWFCAQCDVAWHSGIDCEEYGRLNEEERRGDDFKPHPSLNSVIASSSLADGDFSSTTLFIEENKLSVCDICTEFTELNSINGCAHSFCIDCITKHISSKLELKVAKVQCPGLSCKTFLQTESLTPLLPKSVVDSWSDALCRDFLNDLQTLYCPFKDCSEMLLIENEGEVVRYIGGSKNFNLELECPSCHRLFCAQCDVAWHLGIDCEEYGRLNEEERKRMKMHTGSCSKSHSFSDFPSSIVVLNTDSVMASSSLADGDFGVSTLSIEENKLSVCDICTEFTELNSINGCAHSFCIDCITKHISSKLELNVPKVQCPGLSCKTFLQAESLTPLLPKSVVDSWSDALCRDFLNDLQTLYCPFKDCSEMLLIENEGEVVRELECPSCHRLFCAQCDVAWHLGIDCEEYGRLNEEERKRMKTHTGSCSKSHSFSDYPSSIVVLNTDSVMASSSLADGDFGVSTLSIEENKLSVCDICTEFTELNSINGCAHSFCIDCITKHISSKLELNIPKVQCPGLSCKTFLQAESLTPLLPKSVIDSWSDVLSRDFLNDLQTVYCPFKDCSEMLLIENEGEVVRESECPSCHRLFCAQCEVAWHLGIDCEEYGRLNEEERGRDDLMVRELAEEFKWSRCPSCKFYVERTQGCPHITCRCNYQFCYGCGLEWSGNHSGCSRD